MKDQGRQETSTGSEKIDRGYRGSVLGTTLPFGLNLSDQRLSKNPVSIGMHVFLRVYPLRLE